MIVPVVEAARRTAPACTDPRPYYCLIVRYFGAEAPLAYSVASAENGTHDPNRTHLNSNHSIDTGLFQINSIHRLPNLTDPETNIADAKMIRDTQGWTAWVTYNTKAYLNH